MNARPTPVHPRWVEIEELIERAVEEAMYGRLTPDSALHRARADIDELSVAAICVNEGRTLKRFRARAKGRAARILKRTSHFSVTVSDK